jgi:hypothetical protein
MLELYSDGNLTFTTARVVVQIGARYSFLGIKQSQGKWYAEVKVTTANSV